FDQLALVELLTPVDDDTKLLLVFDRIVAKQVVDMVVDEPLESKRQLMADTVIVGPLVHHKNVVVHEHVFDRIVAKQVVDMVVDEPLEKTKNAYSAEKEMLIPME
nr:hypothetical protein [Tanacetum cinerariifolium]